MASHDDAQYSGPDTIEGLIADRERMWSGFTSATTGAVIVLIILLIGMAFFLL